MHNSTRGFPPPGGWSIRVRDGDIVRHFVVAMVGEADALEAVVAKVAGAELVSSELLTRDLVLSLDMASGEVKERSAGAEAGFPPAQRRGRRRAPWRLTSDHASRNGVPPIPEKSALTIHG
jgi:hypothetical protein